AVGREAAHEAAPIDRLLRGLEALTAVDHARPDRLFEPDLGVARRAAAERGLDRAPVVAGLHGATVADTSRTRGAGALDTGRGGQDACGPHRSTTMRRAHALLLAVSLLLASHPGCASVTGLVT